PPLGGRYRERVGPFASLLMDLPERLAEHLLALKAQGFKAFKIGWGPFGRQNSALDGAIVRAGGGAGGPCWRDPLHPDAREDYTRLRAPAPLPISGGEVLTRRQSFLPWLRAGAFD